MKSYVILLRGINVGGKNKIPMIELKRYLEEQGFEEVVTYIQSGNVVLRSNLGAKTLGEKIEAILLKIYYRLPSLTSPNATKSYLNKVSQKPLYQSITMRNWNTTVKLLKILEEQKI